MTTQASRREFLRLAGRYGALGAAAPLALNLSAIGSAAAANASGPYKALVCIFLYGGNDPHNTLIPYDGASYTKYASARGSLAVPQASLINTLINPSAGWGGTRRFALHPRMTALKAIYDQGKLAPVMRLGTLARPVTVADFQAGRNLPPKLMSHNDQFVLWQTMMTEGAQTGWGGRLGDLLAYGNGANALLTNISVGSSAVFSSGKVSQEFSMGAAGVSRLAPVGIAPETAAKLEARLRADDAHLLNKELAARIGRGQTGAAVISAALGNQVASSLMPETGLGQQLGMVARLIGANQSLGMNRQVFFVSMGGFDSHASLGTDHPELLQELSDAMAAFQSTLDAMGMGQQVTSFTASDFGRSLTTNGRGSDHGWAGHQLVMGGAVKPQIWTGALPSLTLGGIDDVGQGRLLPAVSVEQYGATLAKWMGVSAAEMPTLFPSIGNFATADLGFMR